MLKSLRLDLPRAQTPSRRPPINLKKMNRFVLPALSATLLLAAGCAKAPKNEPPAGKVEQAVKATLPPFLTLESLKTEPVPVGPEKIKVNFSAALSPKEDLFIADGELEGDSEIVLLRPVMKTGTRANAYGYVIARRMMEDWQIEHVEVVSGKEQFGGPRGAFGPQAVVAGSPEAEAALQRVKAKLEEGRRQKEEQERENERARQEMEARRHQEIEALKERLLQATTPGTRYIGFLTNYYGQHQPLRLEFTERNGFMVKAVAVNPQNPSHSQSFHGQLAAKPDEEDRSKENKKFYPIWLSPVSPQEFMAGRWDFYRHEGWLGLEVSEDGLEGSAYMAGDYRVRLQKEK